MSTASSPFFSTSEAAEIDPLGLDGFMQDIAAYNLSSNTTVLTRALESAIKLVPELPSHPDIAIASLRDIDIILSSLLRHEINPVEAQPGITSTLKSLGEIATNVPRGTIATYVGINPSDYRRRHFTSTEEEVLFVDSLAGGYHLLDSALNDIATIKNDSSTLDIVGALGSSMDAIDNMRNAIVTVHKNISPEFFSTNIRPYFEPLEVDGEVYAAPGGSQLQLLGIEYALWGCDSADAEYASYFIDNLKYLTAEQKHMMFNYLQNNGGESIFTRAQHEGDSSLRDEVANVMRSFRKFRYPHKKVADDNFAIRPDGSVGSGHYTPKLLVHLILQTNGKIKQLTEEEHDRF